MNPYKRVRTVLRSRRYRNQIQACLNSAEGRIAVTGCARSGTRYVSKLFRLFGYEVGHENLRKHGISSWCLAPDTTEHRWGPSPADLAPLNLPYVLQVRHPLLAISSITTTGKRSWKFISTYVPIEGSDSLVLKAMKYWFYWNLLALKRAVHTYQVEKIETEMALLFKIGGFDESRLNDETIQSLNRDVNWRGHARLGWQDLESEDAELAERIRNLARRFGYEID